MLHQSIVIVGGGPVGLTLALTLARQGKQVLVIDKSISKESDGRVLALSYASQIILSDLKAWPKNLASPIDCVQISHPGLGISNIQARALKLDHLGFTIKYADLCFSLSEQVEREANIQFLAAEVSSVAAGKHYATLSYKDKLGELDYLTAELVIMAEGGRLIDNQQKKLNLDYQQQALVAHIATKRKSAATAYERFTELGPLVVLPYAGHYVMVWSLANHLAVEFKNDPAQLIANLDREFTHRLGGAQLLSPVSSFPLKLTQVKQRLLQRVVLIGNSAQTVHPVSAQGLNLGLRDVLVLAELLANSLELKLDQLAEFDRLRNRDANSVIGFTHFLASFFEQRGKLLNHLRGAGIIALSNLPLAQNFIAKSLIFGI